MGGGGGGGGGDGGGGACGDVDHGAGGAGEGAGIGGGWNTGGSGSGSWYDGGAAWPGRGGDAGEGVVCNPGYAIDGGVGAKPSGSGAPASPIGLPSVGSEEPLPGVPPLKEGDSVPCNNVNSRCEGVSEKRAVVENPTRDREAAALARRFVAPRFRFRLLIDRPLWIRE